MKIKDIVRASATLLSLEKIIEYLDSENKQEDLQIQKQINILVDLANLVINELATTYVYMFTSEKVIPKEGKIYFSNLNKKIIKVDGVFDERGNKLSYKIHPEYIITTSNASTVRYAHLPETKNLEEESGYQDKDLSVRLLAYGLCAEYCLVERRFDEAVMWHKRFMDAVSVVCLPKTATLKKRSFS